MRRQPRTTLRVLSGIVIAVALAASAPVLARSGQAKVGEVNGVHEEERQIVISGEIYALATALRLIGPDGKSLSLADLSEHPSAAVVYETRYGRPHPMIVKLHVLAEPSE